MGEFRKILNSTITCVEEFCMRPAEYGQYCRECYEKLTYHSIRKTIYASAEYPSRQKSEKGDVNVHHLAKKARSTKNYRDRHR